MYIKDRNGNGLEMTYTWRGADYHDKILTRVTATAPDSRYLDFEYESVPLSQPLQSSQVTTVTASWTGNAVSYSYENGLLHEVQAVSGVDSTTRLIEKYDRVNMPPWYDANNPDHGDLFIYWWMNIYRPNGTGGESCVASYALENSIDSEPAAIKYDGAGTKVIWPTLSYYDGHSGMTHWAFSDASGEGVEIPPGGYSHYVTPESWHVLDYTKPSGQQIVRKMFQDVRDSELGHAQNASIIPKQICKGMDGPNGSVTCDTGSHFTYSGQFNANDPQDFKSTQISTSYSDGSTTAYYYYTNTGRVSGVWFGDDRNTSYTQFDSKGNVLAKVENGDRFTTYVLDAYGRIQTQTTALGTETFVHDNWGHVRAKTDVEGRTSYVDYNLRGLKTAVGSLGTTTTYEYDKWDRLTTVTDNLGYKTVYAYNDADQVLSVTDPLKNSTTYAYSATTGTLSSVTDAENGTISYEYDLYGNVKKLTDQREKVTVYTYDTFGRLKTEVLPDPQSFTTTYNYDDGSGCSSCGGGSGHLTSINEDGYVTNFSYDVADRLTTVSRGTMLVVHGYDHYGRRTSTYDNRLPVGDYPTQTFEWEYDKFDRVVNELYPDGEEVAWAYDVSGRRTSLTDPDDNVTNYIYYQAYNNKKLRYIIPAFGDYSELYYNSNGLLDSEYNDTGYTKLYSYDWLNRLEVLASYDVNNMPLAEYYYTYNPAGMITDIAGVQRWSSGYNWVYPNKQYSYDKTYRLTMEQRKYGNSVVWRYGYEYDSAGNRLKKHYFDGSSTATTSYNYDDFNQLTSDSNADYYYEDGYLNIKFPNSGIMIGYNHDVERRLTSMGGDLNGPQYVYDASGRLLMRTDANGNKRKYYYDGINTLLSREKPAGSGTCFRTASAFVLKDAPIGQIVTEMRYNYPTNTCVQSPTTEYVAYHYDHVGNVIALSDCDGNGTMREGFDMEAFGTMHQGSQNGVRLTTKEYDPDAGLYYFGARWYDPELGKWMEKEPLYEKYTNQYMFNNNNPLKYVDVDGWDATVWPWQEPSGSPRIWKDGPRNGNWGGKDWAGGVAGGGIGTAPPTDSADCCYMDHDLGWTACDRRYAPGSVNNKRCKDAADRILLRCLGALPSDPRRWPMPPRPGTEGDSRRFRGMAEWYF